MKLDLKSPAPGVYENISNEDYDKINAMRNSNLTEIDKTPAHSKVRGSGKDTIAKSFGRILHVFVLEEEDFDNKYVVGPKLNKNTNAWKEFVKVSEEQGRTVIDQKDYDKAVGMKEAIMSHPIAGNMIGKGLRETTIIWEDERTGIMCKARTDAVPDGNRATLVDVKSTKDASPTGFQRAVLNYGYHRQAAFYLRGMNAVSEESFDAFAFVAVEKEEPYRVQVFILDDMFMGYGASEVDRLLDIEVECRRNNFWPHFTTDKDTGDVIGLELPGWIG